MNEDLLNEVLSCDTLPSPPGLALQVLQMAKDPDSDIDDMATLISADPALSAKILKTVNSSFYGLSKSVSTISQALVILGLQSVRTLALGFSLVGSLNKARESGFDMNAYWRRNIYAAVAARTLGEHVKLPQIEEAFLAALLQDIGVLAMYTALGNRYGEVHAQVACHEELADAERRQLGVTHAEIGYRIAEEWSLPPLLVAPIRGHHDPDTGDPEVRDVVRVVHLAWRLAEVYIHSDPSETVKKAKDAAEAMFNIRPSKVERILESVNTSAHELADLFDVNIGARVSSQGILAQARDALVDLTLRSQKEASSLKSRNKELHKKATTDTLTGLANREKFDQEVQTEFDRARDFMRSLGMLFIDADKFKSINDTYGHAVGDEVLRQLSAIVIEACKPMGITGRYGGEEIVCCLPETDVRKAAAIAETIRTTVEATPVMAEGNEIHFTVSIGVACMTNGMHFESPEELVAAADRAMYVAKKQSRNTIRICKIGVPAATV